MKKIIKYIFLLACLGAVGIGILIFGIIMKYKMELPDVQELVENYEVSAPSIIYDRNGEVVDTLYQEARDNVSLEEIPEYSKQAFLAIEDKRFYEHHGIDPRGLLRALFVNLRSGHARQGASSITQQLAKNAFLTMDRTLSRKIKELIITIEIERVYTKEEILEKYLNEIYFGSGAYGLKTAAKQFFHKDIQDINLAEAAMLAGIPNRPEGYNPRRKLDNAIKRMNIVLAEMREDGRITEEEYQEALTQKFISEQEADPKEKTNKKVTIIYPRKDTRHYENPEFTKLVEDFLLKKFDANTVYNKGLKIYSTMDVAMQKTARETFNQYPLLKARKGLNGAMVTIDPFSGQVITMVGGKDFKIGNFNRAIMAKRQFGSSFKPFVYFAALLNGFESNSVLEDSAVHYGKWSPKNANGIFSDTNTTLVNALDKSINSVSVKLLAAVGVPKFRDMMKQVDPKLDIPDNLTAALGTAEGSPLQLAIDYAMFVNGGYLVSPIIITSIEDKHGNLLYEVIPRKDKLFESQDTSIITYMLKSSVQSGTSARARVITKTGAPMEQGGKTGTTNSARTVWYAGITPEYVTTAYLGYDNNRAMPGLGGGNAVAPLYHNYYQEIVNKGLYLPGKFSFMEDHIKNGELVVQKLDILTGLLSSEGREFVVRRGHTVVENDFKYLNGISSIFYGNPSSSEDAEEEKTEEREEENSVEEQDRLFEKLLGE
ncbi:penicillin-binding protein, 1A family [Fusobacterium necrophorum subsp. funduliforme ATCC 51357]|uniref:Penicillin-binding protein n=1 Tax=Fusobacterium necrophorum subsp. funduliforme TaxID=143387 RepID=A0A162JAT5_9FUSO|nr:transglycosylase domain-containing protein [Fusobacterium necrophorum]AYV93001.1 penicillin-binding protein [Fusobacterium necrophorum subsp. funduliforme]EIJ68954.1 penicillin-binding protein, 1A family [Fusobacterium necrophorum subsp. funduliforme ATCC 51357]KAB0554138.1 penicillin-binding protein [Fusobacterium necrophorum subsp. funduliforme]KYL05453.1 penicillin-binding protein [Fusobacterium necrophorum subsp. funduliforme]KYM45368.1 penicillin-binding protein [Fusobacterium necropho